MIIEPRHLEFKDYRNCMINTFMLLTRRPIEYILLACMTFMFALGKSSDSFLVLVPGLTTLFYFCGIGLAKAADNQNENPFVSVLNMLRTNTRYIGFTLISSYTVFGIFSALIATEPAKFIGWAMLTTALLISIFGYLHKALLRAKYGAEPYEAFSLMVDADERNKPFFILIPGGVFMLLSFPVLVAPLLAPYSILLYANYSYVLNKALFDGNSELEEKQAEKSVATAEAL
ncbi:hypothetical protein A3715_17755 [Oleiphilus sp. HI0009]|nr:hypothetical protein A3715_11370 [Oleiphilus sp. HI0009]KZX84345.1 hypothetical protein A3715_17755 [Oleiphilus sp. HI0009]